MGTRMNEQIETLFQTFHETRQAEVTSGEQRVSREQILLNDATADAKKAVANIKEEYSLKIDRLVADTDREVQRINDNTVRKFINTISKGVHKLKFSRQSN